MLMQSPHYLGASHGSQDHSQEERCPRILLAEDDEAIRRLTARMLKQGGCEVEECEDGAVAWEQIQRECYDLLLTDYQMPHLTGLELVEKVRSADMALPVILASGTLPLDELKAKSWLRIGATLQKPYRTDELLSLIEALLQTEGRAKEQLEECNHVVV